MSKFLMVLSGPLDSELVRRGCEAVPSDAAEVGLCYELARGRDGLADGIAAQRTLTAILRQLKGAAAESIPIFVVCDREGQRAADCARAWDASLVWF